MKKLFAVCAAILTVMTLSIPNFADEGEKPICAADIADGTYSIEVQSSSSMFRVVDCQLTVSDDTMTAVMTMSGQGYGYLFMGTGEEALAADESLYIPFELNEEGQKTFKVPVEALDMTVKCAAWSIKKSQWYDRDLVFKSDTLPKNAVTRPVSVSVPVVIGAAAAGAAVLALIGTMLFRAHKHRMIK